MKLEKTRKIQMNKKSTGKRIIPEIKETTQMKIKETMNEKLTSGKHRKGNRDIDIDMSTFYDTIIS